MQIIFAFIVVQDACMKFFRKNFMQASCATMNENEVRNRKFCGIFKAYGTRPILFAAMSATEKLVLTLPLNHKLSMPQGKKTYSKINCFRRVSCDNLIKEIRKWKLSTGVVVGSMCIRK
jgi:hypothetical protein